MDFCLVDPYFPQVHVQIAVYMRAHTSSAIIYASLACVPQSRE